MCSLALLFLWLCLFTGTVDIPLGETWKTLTGQSTTNTIYSNIIMGLRVPMTFTALLTGAALGVAGLLLQTTFNNPLAGPSILGVSTGASFGVAVILLAAPGLAVSAGLSALIGATAGAFAVMAILIGMSSFVRSSMMLLIIGIMVSYLTSSAISILNFYATQEGVHSFVIWGLGNFSGVGEDNLLLYSLLIVLLLVWAMLLAKPLNALLLGERYASDIGTDIRKSRTMILLVSGLLTAVTTAFCGPIGFIGLVVPHIARLSLGTSNHKALLPAVILTGSVTGLLTLWLSNLPGDTGTLPVNAITSIIGVPVVIYIILNRRRISYFN